MNVIFKRLSKTAIAPTKATRGSAAYDLYADVPDDVRLRPGERVVIPTGLSLAIAARFAGLILPRSGNAKNHGIMVTNSPGLIDPDYRGEIKILLFNSAQTGDFLIHPGDRIAQILFIQITSPMFTETQDLDETTRGLGGFGSTGK
jgi:dUTP pyrophosphatase